MIFGYEPGFLICIFIVSAALIMLLINFAKYSWKNGELKTRIALQVWAWFKLFHIVATYQGFKHYIFLAISLSALLYIVLHNFNRKPEHG